jgi:hypothetical protein
MKGIRTYGAIFIELLVVAYEGAAFEEAGAANSCDSASGIPGSGGDRFLRAAVSALFPDARRFVYRADSVVGR